MTFAQAARRDRADQSARKRSRTSRGSRAATAGYRLHTTGYLLLAMLAWLIALPAQATMICRWVDDAGRTQLAEIVPEKYVQSARCTDSKQFEISAERTRQAEERARQLRQQADISNQTTGDAPAAPLAAPGPRSAGSQADKRPARGVDQSTDCATWRRLYQESSACFAPYRTVGGTKAEAFEKCQVIPSPVPKCGPPSN